jgi:hypothetical protein
MQYLCISHTIVPNGLFHSSPASHFKTSQVIEIYFPE